MSATATTINGGADWWTLTR